MEKKSTKNLSHSQSTLIRIQEEEDEEAQPLNRDANEYETLSLPGLNSPQTQLLTQTWKSKFQIH